MEENIVDEFAVMGEDHRAARLRAQEEIHQKASAALPDEVSTMINSVMQTTPTHLYILQSPVYSHTHHDNTSRGKETSTDQVRYIISRVL